MTAPTDPTVVRITTPAQMIASVPLWLGYTPTESLVIACLHEPRGRVGLTMRLDLMAEALDDTMAAEVAWRVQAEAPNRVLMLVYTDDPSPMARTPLMNRLRESLGLQLKISEAALVRSDRFWSYLCEDPRCCPAEGTMLAGGGDDPAVRLLAAEQVVRGMVMQPTREALAATLAAPEPNPEREAFFDAAEWEREAEIARTDVKSAGLLYLAGWQMIVERYKSPRASMDDMEAATLVASLLDVRLRDVLLQVEEDDTPAMLQVLHEIAQRTPAGYDAGVCTMYAWLLYCQGGGAEVTILLERVRHSTPNYTLMQMLTQVTLQQIPPTKVRELTRKLAAS